MATTPWQRLRRHPTELLLLILGLVAYAAAQASLGNQVRGSFTFTARDAWDFANDTDAKEAVEATLAVLVSLAYGAGSEVDPSAFPTSVAPIATDIEATLTTTATTTTTGAGRRLQWDEVAAPSGDVVNVAYEISNLQDPTEATIVAAFASELGSTNAWRVMLVTELNSQLTAAGVTNDVNLPVTVSTAVSSEITTTTTTTTTTVQWLHSVCLGNTGDSYATVSFTTSIEITEVRFHWTSGGLACNGNWPSYNSGTGSQGRWGCLWVPITTPIVTLRMTDAATDTEILPFLTSASNRVTGMNSWTNALLTNGGRQLTGLAESDATMAWPLISDLTIAGGDYRIWDYEDLTNTGESDNTGTVCYNVEFVLVTTTTTTTTTTTSRTTTTTTTTTTMYISPTGGDPVTYYGDVRKEFVLPVGKLTCLLQTPEVRISADVFATENAEQWFYWFSVSSLDGRRIVDVRIKKDIDKFNRTASPPRAFQTLNVWVAGDSRAPLAVMPEESTDVWGAALGFSRMDQAWLPVQQTRIGPAHRECAEVNTHSLHFAICSTPAYEYFGWQRHLSVQYAHLDLLMLRMPKEPAQDLEGVLPELWGLRPMTETTRQMTLGKGSPELPADSSYAASVLSWTGGKVQSGGESEV